MAKIDVFEVAPKKGDMPFTPYLHIYLSEHSSDSEGHTLLSPQLMTDKEIDAKVAAAIQALKRGGAKKEVVRVWNEFKRENPEEDAECESNLYVLFDDDGDFLRWGVEHEQYFTGHSGPTTVIPISEALEWRDVEREIGEALTQFFDV